MNEAIYRTTVKTPTGTYSVAALTTEEAARYDLRTVAVVVSHLHPGQVRIAEVIKSNRRKVASMWPVKGCATTTSNGETIQWGWACRA